MRRSKSNPAKYTRNYQKISQRRMTDDDAFDNDDEKLLEKLERQRKESMGKLLNSSDVAEKKEKKCRKRNRRTVDKESGKNNDTDGKDYDVSIDIGKEDGDEQIIILPRKKKKEKNNKDFSVELTPNEIRLARSEHKALKRKMAQLERCREQKNRRKQAYGVLAEHAVGSQELSLMFSSSTLGKKESKRERLRRIWKHHKAGMELSNEEKDLLLTKVEVCEEDTDATASKDSIDCSTTIRSKPISKKKKKSPLIVRTKTIQKKGGECPSSDKSGSDSDSDSGSGSGSDNGSDISTCHDDEKSENSNVPQRDHAKDDDCDNESHETNNATEHVDALVNDKRTIDKDVSVKNQEGKTRVEEPKSSRSLAQQMMSGLVALKTQSQQEKEKLDRIEHEKKKEEELRKLEAERNVTTKPYVLDSTPNLLETVAYRALKEGTKRKLPPTNKNCKQLPSVNRPADVKETRQSLPVCSMEFEIMDAVQSNAVIIVCGETGSGKSTQIPQFLYEGGYSSDTMTIGMTQPRRVAAVSTAKRISYEMSCSKNSRTISKNNLVGYQTRFETNGIGKNTRIKVMTDGILLREIQNDLLLRKYSVIVLDEAHERNLNTDILLGLISKSLMLRKEAAKEESSSLPELKLVIMSATLRVQDFTENNALFGDDYIKPVVVNVPGRTFPVTIHHAKTTELDDYETAVLKKVCKIHRKLPDGGILVFLTGKQEINRMVRRLRQCLNRHQLKDTTSKKIVADDFEEEADTYVNHRNCDGPRGLDDDEIDGDLFRNDEDQDDNTSILINNTNDNLTDQKPALILSLHSLLSPEEQSKVFAPVLPPEYGRLIVVATNIAETSVTIPNISYVVDSGRHKCLNLHPSTGVTSYDVMWISKASADQRAGRAGRTGPGHCYRLYSSSLYDRQMNKFAVPEILVRPLEDVVLAMKNMGIENTAEFPFVTQPDKTQILSACRLLMSIGCLKHNKESSREKNDGLITKVGKAVSMMPLGVRYGKMLFFSAQAGVLDYAIALVAILSESNPFLGNYGENNIKSETRGSDEECLDEVDQSGQDNNTKQKKWLHNGGDVLAGLLAVGAYSYAGRGAGGKSEYFACQTFCEDNGLNFVVMQRIQKLRLQLAKMIKVRLGDVLEKLIDDMKAESVALKTGGIIYDMPPPNNLEEKLLKQVILAGLLDNVARLTPPATMSTSHSNLNLRTAYKSCNPGIHEPLFLHRNSVLYTRDFRRLPEWVCYDSIVRKPSKDGSTTICTMQNVTPIDASWLPLLSDISSGMFSTGSVLDSPSPYYDVKRDAVMCFLRCKFGPLSWQIPPVAVNMKAESERSTSTTLMIDDSHSWFARFLLEGKVIKDLGGELSTFLNDSPLVITKKKPLKKVVLLVSALSSEDVDTAHALRKHWAEKNQKFLFRLMEPWVKKDKIAEFRRFWVNAVKKNVSRWKVQDKTNK